MNKFNKFRILIASVIMIMLLFSNVFSNLRPPDKKTPSILPMILIPLSMGAGYVLTILVINDIKKRIGSNKYVFQSEKIEFVINNNDFVSVNAKYWIKNIDDKKMKVKLLYPFPDNSYIKSASGISIKTIYQDSTVNHNYEVNENNWVFNTILEPRIANIIEVRYVQKTNNRSFKYILTSTKIWGEPLKSANFMIKIPKTYTLNSASYDYSFIEHTSMYNIYEINKKDFMPDKELEFSWIEK